MNLCMCAVHDGNGLAARRLHCDFRKSKLRARAQDVGIKQRNTHTHTHRQTQTDTHTRKTRRACRFCALVQRPKGCYENFVVRRSSQFFYELRILIRGHWSWWKNRQSHIVVRLQDIIGLHVMLGMYGYSNPDNTCAVIPVLFWSHTMS